MREAKQCDMSKGDVQCPWVLPYFGGGHLNCTLVEGHEGGHLTHVEFNCPEIRSLGKPQAEWEKGPSIERPQSGGR